MSRDADTITDEQVAAIADRMVEEGKRVSPVAIWKELESGSLVEIVEALQRWRDVRQPRTADKQVQQGLPSNVAESIMSAADRIWAASQDQAERAFNERMTAVGQHLDAAFAERDEAFTEYQKTIDEYEAARERLAVLTTALNAAEHNAQTLSAELADLTGRAEVAETRVEELELRASADHTHFETTKAALDEERQARETLAATLLGKEDDIARVTGERDHAQQQATALSEACDAKAEEAQRWSEKAAAATSRAQDAEARIEELELRATEEAAKHDATRASLDEEREAREALVEVVSNKDAEIARVTQEHDQENDHVRQQIAALNDAHQAKSAEAERWSREANAAAARAQTAETRIEELERRVAEQTAALEAGAATLAQARDAHDKLTELAAAKDAEIARLRLEHEQAQQQIATLNDNLEAKTEEAQRWSMDAAAATSRAQAAETRIEELVQRASEEDFKLEATKTSLDEERQAREALAERVSAKDAEIARIEQERDYAQQEVASLDRAREAKADEAQRWSQDANAAIARAQSAEARIEELERQASEQTVALATAEARVEELVQQAAEAGAKLDAAHANLEEERSARDTLTELVKSKDAETIHVLQERDHALQQVAALEQTRQANSEEAQRWSQEADAAAARAQAAESQAKETLARIAALEGELDEARHALAAERQSTATHHDEASARLDEVRRINQELDEARHALAAERQATATHQDEASAHLDEVRRINQELDAAREQIGNLNAAAAGASDEHARLEQEANAASARADAAEQHAAQLQKQLAERERPESAKKHARRNPHPDSKEDDDSAEEIAALQRQISAQAKAHTKAFDELRSNAEQWVAHAKELKQRLGLASERIMFVDARSTGEVVLVRRLSSELERLKPDHELIARDAQQKLISATMAQQLAQKGYRYDPATAVMSKIER